VAAYLGDFNLVKRNGAVAILALGLGGCQQAKDVHSFTMTGEGAAETLAYIRREGGASRWFPRSEDCALVRIEPALQPRDGESLAANVQELTATWICQAVTSPLRISVKLTDKKVSAVFPHYAK